MSKIQSIDAWITKRTMGAGPRRETFCRPAGAGCSWGDGTQRSRAGLSSDGPPGLGPRIGCRAGEWVSCRWCASCGISSFEPLARCGARECFNPSGVVPFSYGNPGCASRPHLLKTLGDRRNRPKGLHRDRSRSRAGSRPHHLYPTRRGLTRNPTGRPLPQASVSGSVSASGSKPFRSVATAGCARTGAAGNSKRDVDIFRRQSILSPRSGPR